MAFLARISSSVVQDHQRQLMSEKRRANVVPIETAKAGEMAGVPSTDSAEFDSSTLSSILSWIDIERIVDGDPDRSPGGLLPVALDLAARGAQLRPVRHGSR